MPSLDGGLLDKEKGHYLVSCHTKICVGEASWKLASDGNWDHPRPDAAARAVPSPCVYFEPAAIIKCFLLDESLVLEQGGFEI